MIEYICEFEWVAGNTILNRLGITKFTLKGTKNKV